MLKATSETLNIGDIAPDFELPTVDKRTVRLLDYQGKPSPRLHTWNLVTQLPKSNGSV